MVYLLFSCQNDLADHISWLDSRACQSCTPATPTPDCKAAAPSVEASQTASPCGDSGSSQNSRKPTREKVNGVC